MSRSVLTTRRLTPLAALALAIGLTFALPGTAATTPADNTSKACVACHADASKHYANTRHAIADGKTPGANCATCHGEVLRHLANPMKEKPQFTFKKDVKGFMDEKTLAESNKVCTSCHQGSTQQHWAGSAHESAQVGCVSCHTEHDADIALDPKTSTALCVSCHSEQKSGLFKSSSHPLLSGQMNCVSCHNPHGTAPGNEKLLKGESVNDTCYTCHPGKRGPFVHPHEAVTENCANCHDVHGTNRMAMLKMEDPMLCTSCHSTAPHDNPSLNNANPVTSKAYVRTGCIACHKRIHGSNSVQGQYLVK